MSHGYAEIPLRIGYRKDENDKQGATVAKSFADTPIPSNGENTPSRGPSSHFMPTLIELRGQISQPCFCCLRVRNYHHIQSVGDM
jgi:hypothetical protein